MNFTRYLCSHLVVLKIEDQESVVNLEEIWQTGAVLESEASVAEGAKAELRCDASRFAGRIVNVERHEVGWKCDMEFSPLTPWSPERFRPDHLLDPSTL